MKDAPLGHGPARGFTGLLNTIARMTDGGEEIIALASEGEYVAPQLELGAFHCAHCGVLAPQQWDRFLVSISYDMFSMRCTCSNCRRMTYWLDFSYVNGPGWKMVMPRGGGERPHVLMPQDVMVDYEEARAIVAESPRGACALLRLATQKLLPQIGGNGGKIDDEIAELVKQGLPIQVQQALDTLRVVGNNAVHPGELDLIDDVDTAQGLFTILNFIVQDRIAQPRALEKMYEKLPQGAKDAIARRDGKR